MLFVFFLQKKKIDVIIYLFFSCRRKKEKKRKEKKRKEKKRKENPNP
jgi:hypothetical protein